MKVINLKKVAYSYGERPVFTGVNLKCNENERLCILGENGTGKSTLLKIISGQLEPEGGMIEKNSHIRAVYVPQEFPAEYAKVTVAAYVEKVAGVTLLKKVQKEAEELGFNVERHNSALCGSLSGGQQKILALSTAFASNPDFLLLDEPENHIDIVSRMVLIDSLKEYKGGVIFISHDRLIIDSIATKVAELANGVIHVSEGGYDDYIEEKMARIGGLQRHFDTETKRIKQLEATIVILRQKAIRGKEISAYQRKLAELNDLKAAHKENGRPDDKKTKIKIQAQNSTLHNGKLLCRVSGMSFRYPKHKGDIFHHADLEIRTGTHITLLGRNGSGKSTFLKCLIGDLKPTEGEVIWADNIKKAYFDQHAHFDPDARPIAIVMEKLNCFDEEARAALGAMRFNLDTMNTPVHLLSGGERMRLRFALVFGLKPDLIILDEPTNHLDEVTWEVLLEACKASKSTILLVSHDYEFIQEFNPGIFWVVSRQAVTPRSKELPVLLEEMSAPAFYGV